MTDQPADPADIRRRAARVGAAVRLLDVRTTQVAFELADVSLPSPWESSLQTDSAEWERDGDLMAFKLGFSVAASADEKLVMSLSCTTVALYEVGSELRLDDADAGAFGTLTVLFTVYPYVRELVHSLTARAGLPPLVLDVIRFPIP